MSRLNCTYLKPYTIKLKLIELAFLIIQQFFNHLHPRFFMIFRLELPNKLSKAKTHGAKRNLISSSLSEVKALKSIARTFTNSSFGRF